MCPVNRPTVGKVEFINYHASYFQMSAWTGASFGGASWHKPVCKHASSNVAWSWNCVKYIVHIAWYNVCTCMCVPWKRLCACAANVFVMCLWLIGEIKSIRAEIRLAAETTGGFIAVLSWASILPSSLFWQTSAAAAAECARSSSRICSITMQTLDHYI